MSELERRIEELEAQLAELRASVVASPTPRRGSREAVEEVNRRALLRRGGVAIAGAAAGGAALIANAQPAAAADGAAILQGVTNTGTATTTIRTTAANQTLSVEGRANILTPASNGPAPLRVGQQFSTSYMPTKADGWGDTGSLATIVREDSGADLWYAHAGEDKTAANQNIWGRVQTSQNSNFVQFLTTPTRVLDTRSSGGPVASNSTNLYTLSAAPGDAVGVMGTITLVDAQAVGAYLSLYSGSVATIASPSFSNVNGGPGVNAATSFIVALPTTKQIKVFANATCHILIDVAAWIVTGPRP